LLLLLTYLIPTFPLLLLVVRYLRSLRLWCYSPTALLRLFAPPHINSAVEPFIGRFRFPTIEQTRLQHHISKRHSHTTGSVVTCALFVTLEVLDTVPTYIDSTLVHYSVYIIHWVVLNQALVKERRDTHHPTVPQCTPPAPTPTFTPPPTGESEVQSGRRGGRQRAGRWSPVGGFVSPLAHGFSLHLPGPPTSGTAHSRLPRHSHHSAPHCLTSRSWTSYSGYDAASPQFVFPVDSACLLHFYTFYSRFFPTPSRFA